MNQRKTKMYSIECLSMFTNPNIYMKKGSLKHLQP
uniref:Uncharacterized protein n=1 Tax=Tetranychus urticae TaxID=32264 RepID=T1KJ33_TETUR